jgi:hypothetical protein
MEIVVETFYAIGEKTISPVRVRPLFGQGFSTEMRVECSKKMRTAYPVGQLFLLNVKVISRLDSPDFLYSSYRDKWRPVTPAIAMEFIERMFGDKDSR